MADGLIADLRLSRQYPPNSPAALCAAHQAGWREIALHAALVDSPSLASPVWTLPRQPACPPAFPVLLAPLLRQFRFDRLWLFVNIGAREAETHLSALQQHSNPEGIIPITNENLPPLDNPNREEHPEILFLPDPMDVFKYWKERHRTLSFGRDTPVAHRLVAPGPLLNPPALMPLEP